MPKLTPDYRFTLLGSGTSSGVPTPACRCEICSSGDTRDKRLRPSLLIESRKTTVLVDTSPDFRRQILKYGVRKIDAVIYTHHHFDHIGGFDDIRAFNYSTGKPMPIYLSEKTLASIKKNFFYSFEIPEQRGGGAPMVEPTIVESGRLEIGDLSIELIDLLHGKLKVFGLRIGNFAYCTDVNFIPQDSMKKLRNLDVLIIDALRYTEHTTHFTIDQALEVVAELKPKKTYLTHIAHQVKNSICEKSLPEGVRLSYDGLVVEALRPRTNFDG